MKTLLLIRHAKSDWTFPGLADIDRPLNERGYRDAPLVADELIKTKHIPDLIITSPAVRAATTAMIMARKFEYDPATIQLEKRLYETTPKEYMRILNNISDRKSVV